MRFSFFLFFTPIYPSAGEAPGQLDVVKGGPEAVLEDGLVAGSEAAPVRRRGIRFYLVLEELPELLLELGPRRLLRKARGRR